MKYIFDFDNVLFFAGKRREEKLIPLLEKIGFSLEEIESQYQKERAKGFSMRKFLYYFSPDDDLYEEVMNGIEEYANTELIEIVKNLGKDNCFLVTYGEKEYQLDKIHRFSIEPLFSQIIIIPQEYKKDIIEKICADYKDEQVLFIDDKQINFDDIDFTKCSNLKTILYTGQNIKSLLLP